jgi:uncharacterized protein (TIGR02147 family)
MGVRFMTKLSVFEYKDYKKFITDWMLHAPHKGRGLRKQLAEAINCQTAYITQVLSGNNHLSLEQAEASCRWMKLAETDIEFFLLLVLFQRAGTKALQRIISKQITERREIQTNLQKRIHIHDTLSQTDQIKYYSSWHYAAIHIAVLIPALQTPEALQNYFHLPMSQIRKVLDFLLSCGFIKQEKNQLKVIRPTLHLELNSPLLHQHHTNWRLKVIESLVENKRADLHYSGTMVLSEEDYEWVREKLSQLLEEIIPRIRDSKDEKLACLNFDWFQV